MVLVVLLNLRESAARVPSAPLRHAAMLRWRRMTGTPVKAHYV